MRSVVLKTSIRCPACRLSPRWCICLALRTIETPLAVDVIIHHRELHRPSSTGHLINRVVTGSRQHLWRRERKLSAAELRLPGREVWVLHPSGEPMPADVDPRTVQVLLLDGSWRESSNMARAVDEGARAVSLPMTGESRYWLRTQQDGGRFSTAEAMLFLLSAFGLGAAHETLRLQFELHVYAHLRARGSKEAALEFLKDSPIHGVFGDLISQLDVRRPR
jgi:DTW domain-containing protein